MLSKIIPFSYEIKITNSDFCYYVVYYSNKGRHSGSLFSFYFFISMKTNSERINCQACNIVTLLKLYCDAFYGKLNLFSRSTYE